MSPPSDTAKPEGVRLALAPKLDLGAATSLREALLTARGGPVSLDGADVRHLGAAALQVLIAARAVWAEDGAGLRVDAPSDALVTGLERLGASIDAIAVEARQ